MPLRRSIACRSDLKRKGRVVAWRRHRPSLTRSLRNRRAMLLRHFLARSIAAVGFRPSCRGSSGPFSPGCFSASLSIMVTLGPPSLAQPRRIACIEPLALTARERSTADRAPRSRVAPCSAPSFFRASGLPDCTPNAAAGSDRHAVSSKPVRLSPSGKRLARSARSPEGNRLASAETRSGLDDTRRFAPNPYHP